jgi:peroxiredoxin
MPTQPERVPVGAKAPDFTLASPGRADIRLADYRGRDQVLLVFLRAFG